MRISDDIEAFIMELFNQEDSEVELKRNELAEYFNCAPSQINYVLSTRFTPAHGYRTESRRGGGGCIRIVRVVNDPTHDLQWLMDERIGESISAASANVLLATLRDQGTITAEQADLIASGISDRVFAVPVPQAAKDALRARCVKSMLLSAIGQNNPVG